MNQYVHRHIGFVVSGLASFLLLALIVAFGALQQNASLSADLDDAERALVETQSDLAVLAKDFDQVQGGTALFAAQVTAFQEQLASLAPGVAAGLGDAITGLDTFATSTLEFEVVIDEDIPIDTVIVLNRTITVPIQTTIPIDEIVETTISVSGPFGIDIPLDVTVPIKLDLPVDLDVSFAIDEQIPLSTSIPVNLNVPIVIDIANTELASLVASLRVGLVSMQDILAGLG